MRHKINRIPRLQSESQKVYSGTQELLDNEDGLAGYNLDVVRKFALGLGLNKIHNEAFVPTSVIEFGAGTGALAEIWRREYDLEPICIEIDLDLIHILQTKGFEVYETVKSVKSKIFYVYTSNVLEHIEDDVEALKRIRDKMEPEGKIAILVPAIPMLFSDLDRSVGHFRRYRKKELLHKLELAGFEVEECFYNDCVGVLASLFVRMFGYKNKIGLGSRKSLLIYDKYVYKASKILDRLLFRHLVGKNLFLFAVNPKS